MLRYTAEPLMLPNGILVLDKCPENTADRAEEIMAMTTIKTIKALRCWWLLPLAMMRTMMVMPTVLLMADTHRATTANFVTSVFITSDRVR